LTLCRKIKDIKQYTVDEGQKMNESLKNYQMAFEKKLKNLHDELSEKFRKE
jgi:inhibitor of KinA sporulation pathway (predicted exonuclease)